MRINKGAGKKRREEKTREGRKEREKIKRLGKRERR